MGYYSKLYLDYPVEELGDTPNTPVPLREIDEVISYDGDKYCEVRVQGVDIHVKACYITYTDQPKYHDKGTEFEYKYYPSFDPNRHFMNNKEYAQYRREVRKKSSLYTVVALDIVDDKEVVLVKHEYQNLAKAIRAFCHVDYNNPNKLVLLNGRFSKKHSTSWEPMMQMENNKWSIFNYRKNTSRIKNFHTNKYCY